MGIQCVTWCLLGRGGSPLNGSGIQTITST